MEWAEKRGDRQVEENLHRVLGTRLCNRPFGRHGPASIHVARGVVADGFFALCAMRRDAGRNPAGENMAMAGLRLRHMTGLAYFGALITYRFGTWIGL